ncbi:hypothetical protein WA026_004331 [Henosepilachna vigintioctopunctata]|uniref:Ethylmalonyl-CoA decarboxylase n=1 Tax=Henosepilachna vigintioctopunctata TaxID=420089 RepID=A0AAW1V9Z4_9CUCU
MDACDLLHMQEYLSQFVGGEIILNRQYWNEGIAIIILNNPSKRNAMSGKMMIDLRNCIEELENWKEGKAVIIHGEGGNFCSGGDLDLARKTGCPEGASIMSTWMMATLKRLSELKMLSVCIARGPTLGGGAELSVFCDYILVADDVKYGFVHGKMGIITAWGGGTKLMQKIGHNKAMYLFLTSKVLSAEECVNLGIAEKVVSSTNSVKDAVLWLNEYLIHHYQVIRSFKELVNTSKAGGDEVACFSCERSLISVLWGGEVNKKMLSENIKHC